MYEFQIIDVMVCLIQANWTLVAMATVFHWFHKSDLWLIKRAECNCNSKCNGKCIRSKRSYIQTASTTRFFFSFADWMLFLAKLSFFRVIMFCLKKTTWKLLLDWTQHINNIGNEQLYLMCYTGFFVWWKSYIGKHWIQADKCHIQANVACTR